ncbi:lipase member H-like [Anticarsia gemmatalis]|uniref:lipase member H-like n=1 Tax=Anticarsia gemmatalis TaxID=129554 RepID=UPI003F76B6AA
MVRILGFGGKKAKFTHNCPKLEFTLHNEADVTSQEADPQHDGADSRLLDFQPTGDLETHKGYTPDKQNVYHLFTRKNPRVSQPLWFNNLKALEQSNFNPRHRTVLLLHGWIADVTADFNTVLVPAFLAAGDVNVLAVDWSAGADTANYLSALTNTRTGGQSAAKFITWLNETTGCKISDFHLVGYSLGAHLAGVIGRSLDGKVGYITGLDPALIGWIFNSDRLRSSDAVYTEIIHTNAGLLGYPRPLGDVDFYPNGGINMPGCTSQMTDHSRSYFYFAESLRSGGFSAKPCTSYIKAMRGKTGDHLDNLKMGGLLPKTGCSGIFYLKTNPQPPFSRG